GVTQQAQEKAQELASQAQEKAQEVKGQVGGRVREEVDRRSTDLGDQAHSIVGVLRRAADDLREEGKDGPARLLHQAAGRVEQLGTFLRDSDSDALLGAAGRFARGKPWLAGGLG